MQLRLVGTGAGVPRPGCPCVGCRADEPRAPLAALVDEQVTLTGEDAGTLTSADGTRLLWAPRGAAEAEGPRYDAVLLGLADLVTWPLELAALRRAGAVTATTYVAAVGVAHDLPPTPELTRLLRGWGAHLPADGAVVDLPAPRIPARPPRVLVLGGARSGKSAYAEQRLAAEPAVTYVATAPPRPDDVEWDARVQAHVTRRPQPWQTIETGDVTQELDRPEALLVDDLGLWLTRLLDAHDAWDGSVPRGVDAACDALVEAWSRRTGTAVIVAPEVGSGVVPATASGRRFRDLLGALTTRLAAQSDEVVQVVAGLPRWLR